MRDPADHAVHPAENAVRQGDQRQKSNQHRANIQAQVQTVARSLRGGVDDVHAVFSIFDLHLAGSDRLVDFRARKSSPA